MNRFEIAIHSGIPLYIHRPTKDMSQYFSIMILISDFSDASVKIDLMELKDVFSSLLLLDFLCQIRISQQKKERLQLGQFPNTTINLGKKSSTTWT